MHVMRMTPRLLVRALSAAAPLPGPSGVRASLVAILLQHRALLQALPDGCYAFQSPLLQASVGQHTRHALDHLRKPLELLRPARAALGAADDADDPLIQYDLRQRRTAVETDRGAALAQIDALLEDARKIDAASVARPVRAAFMLAASGEQFAFESTLSRELAFAVHHCIHHNALSKVLLRHHFPEVELPPDFGMAPSTANYNLHHPPAQEQ